METRANYVLIGLFTLAAVLGAFGFVYWFNNVGSLGDRVGYRVVFETPVSGLRTGGSVLFNGIRIGEVTSLGLDPESPRRVVATISVDKRAAVRADTRVGLDYQGLTGNAAIALRGGSETAPPPAGGTLKADISSSADVTQAARDVLRKLETLISDNDQAFRASLKNIETFTQTLADNDQTFRNSLKNIEQFTQTLADNTQRIDRIMSGAEHLISHGIDAIGNERMGRPKASAAGDHPDPRITATSCVAASVSAAIVAAATMAAASGSAVGSMRQP